MHSPSGSSARSDASASSGRWSSNRHLLKAALSEFVDHCNSQSAHRSISQASPRSPTRAPFLCPDSRCLRRSGQLGGLIHEYKFAAAWSWRDSSAPQVICQGKGTLA
jgi:hypothetical protein